MPYRSTAVPLSIFAVVLLIVVGNFLKRWLWLSTTTSTETGSLEWLSLLGLVVALQVITGYGLWWWWCSRQQSVIKTDVLHSIVHEFQTPISAIRIAADILTSPIAHNRPERTEKYVRIIQEETERLQYQVETMLTLARADRSMLTLNLEPVELHSLLQSVNERHGNYLVLELLDTNLPVLADRIHLTSVLYNLIDNAIKYSLDQPRIIIQTKTNNDSLTIAVRDNGIGIPAKAIAQIFQPFFRVNDPNQRSVKGFGLGLSYVQQIVQLHNWTIWVKSELGKGSEFVIQVPSRSILSNPSKPSRQG